MMDLAIVALVVASQFVCALWLIYWGDCIGYYRGKRDGRQEMWDIFYGTSPAEVGEPFGPEPAIASPPDLGEPVPCQFCADCEPEWCCCRCHRAEVEA
jgi:hypothetical protein